MWAHAFLLKLFVILPLLHWCFLFTCLSLPLYCDLLVVRNYVLFCLQFLRTGMVPGNSGIQYIFVKRIEKNEFTKVILRVKVLHHIFPPPERLLFARGTVLSSEIQPRRSQPEWWKLRVKNNHSNPCPLLHYQGKTLLQNSLAHVSHLKFPTCPGKWVFEYLFYFPVAFLAGNILIMEISIPSVMCAMGLLLLLLLSFIFPWSFYTE